MLGVEERLRKPVNVLLMFKEMTMTSKNNQVPVARLQQIQKVKLRTHNSISKIRVFQESPGIFVNRASPLINNYYEVERLGLKCHGDMRSIEFSFLSPFFHCTLLSCHASFFCACSTSLYADIYSLAGA